MQPDTHPSNHPARGHPSAPTERPGGSKPGIKGVTLPGHHCPQGHYAPGRGPPVAGWAVARPRRFRKVKRAAGVDKPPEPRPSGPGRRLPVGPSAKAHGKDPSPLVFRQETTCEAGAHPTNFSRIHCHPPSAHLSGPPPRRRDLQPPPQVTAPAAGRRTATAHSPRLAAGTIFRVGG